MRLLLEGDWRAARENGTVEVDTWSSDTDIRMYTECI